jgi:hypothetical protein
LLSKHIPGILQVADKLFAFHGFEDISHSLMHESLSLGANLIKRVAGLVKFIMENLYLYLRSLAKFSFISQRIFIYLIYEGFCGEEDKEEEENKEQQEEDDKYFENDGMGMGDGKGGKENVSS